MNVQVRRRRSPVAAIYNAAADHVDAAPLDFWRRHGARAADIAALRPGERVLDVGCGTGASAIPAAEAVGRAGHVLGIDIAEAMVMRARLRADDQGLENIRFRVADMDEGGEPETRFDAVIAGFSLDLAPDPMATLTTLWRLLRPGGRMVVTVLSRDAFQPAAAHFEAELRRFGPGLGRNIRAWAKFADPTSLLAEIEAVTAASPVLVTLRDSERLITPADWWTIAMGSAFRGEIERLDRMERRLLRERVMDRLWEHRVHRIDVTAHCVLARKAP